MRQIKRSEKLGKHLKAEGTDGNQGKFSIQQHEIDSPILPIEQLKQLHEFRPDLVDWVINQTQKEAEHRRSIDVETNSYVFREITLGQILGAIIGIVGTLAGSYVALQGQPAAGIAIASVSMGTLAIAFIARKK